MKNERFTRRFLNGDINSLNLRRIINQVHSKSVQPQVDTSDSIILKSKSKTSFQKAPEIKKCFDVTNKRTGVRVDNFKEIKVRQKVPLKLNLFEEF
jgi:hypothetical protein